MNRTRVLRIIARLNVGGPARHVVWLTEALNNAEFESRLVTGTVPSGEDDMMDFARQYSVEPTVIREMSREISPRDVVTIWKVLALMRRYQPQIIHTHTAKAGFAGRVAGFLYRWMTAGGRRVKFVHTFHGHIFHGYYGRSKTLLFLTIERVLARLATDRILVLSEQQLAEIHGRYRVGRDAQFRIVPLGLDLLSVRGGSSLRAQLGIRHDELVIGIVGRLTPIKNHEMFLRAAAAMPCGFARFVVFGDGSDRARLEHLTVSLGIGDRVLFAGTREARDIYATTDIVALTSRNEGTPLTLIEAMANALPVASTSVGGVVDLGGPVENTRDGYEIRTRAVTVRCDDTTALVAALQRLAADSPLRQRLGAAGRLFVESSYSKERLVADIIALYRELVGEPAGSQEENPT